MNVRRISLSCVLTALLVLPAFAVRAAEEAGGVKSVDEAWQKAMLAGDLEALVACYADDAILWTPHDEVKGKDKIREVFKRMLDGMKVVEVKMEEAHYHTVGDRSVGWGMFKITIKPKEGDGEAQTVRGRFTEVAEKRNGKWVYVVDHASGSPEQQN